MPKISGRIPHQCAQEGMTTLSVDKREMRPKENKSVIFNG